MRGINSASRLSRAASLPNEATGGTDVSRARFGDCHRAGSRRSADESRLKNHIFNLLLIRLPLARGLSQSAAHEGRRPLDIFCDAGTGDVLRVETTRSRFKRENPADELAGGGDSNQIFSTDTD